jgi:death-on-curing protein
VRYLTLAEALLIAEAVTGSEAETLAKASRIELLDSALHSPQAGFGDEEFYPDSIDKPAVLAVRIAAGKLDENGLADWLRERVERAED